MTAHGVYAVNFACCQEDDMLGLDRRRSHDSSTDSGTGFGAAGVIALLILAFLVLCGLGAVAYFRIQRQLSKRKAQAYTLNTLKREVDLEATPAGSVVVSEAPKNPLPSGPPILAERREGDDAWLQSYEKVHPFGSTNMSESGFEVGPTLRSPKRRSNNIDACFLDSTSHRSMTPPRQQNAAMWQTAPGLLGRSENLKSPSRPRSQDGLGEGGRLEPTAVPRRSGRSQEPAVVRAPARAPASFADTARPAPAGFADFPRRPQRDDAWRVGTEIRLRGLDVYEATWNGTEGVVEAFEPISRSVHVRLFDGRIKVVSSENCVQIEPTVQ
eukprot:gnl/TRDRNA2_/TRDRNA2_80570_c0_seq2.p1 gnl/TRDRNA2_/TRDRNA2_80570_c0~~gnl/TRDRNA2_/TRDRNA2_80570_c0_seq2.p1  ORF type:complete len:345 (+),score=39.25 gnl/TRDRNA2_/TRDRNA2_80570_c0_seq2:57-1037(+)